MCFFHFFKNPKNRKNRLFGVFWPKIPIFRFFGVFGKKVPKKRWFWAKNRAKGYVVSCLQFLGFFAYVLSCLWFCPKRGQNGGVRPKKSVFPAVPREAILKTRFWPFLGFLDFFDFPSFSEKSAKNDKNRVFDTFFTKFHKNSDLRFSCMIPENDTF